ncbi:hypothetical protein HDC90_000142 [Pedobacter sp. AK013]|uniref:transglutaminase domain-containing protein n=1 Tax=Pedobacter sp. AK013 TaxID=2723071 RepID=UPI0016201856|nr:transglutaminase domain-containing protein [Pedobacter sp. AK013]MBB6235545.1 hypothetical protein [Pedobacter sp. AK013]
MGKQLFFIFLLTPLLSFSQSSKSYPAEVEAVLKKAGKNRIELEKVITHCKKNRDPLKLKAAYFLIANMDIHYSIDYCLTDGADKKIEYNEFAYPNYDKAVQALEDIKHKTPDINVKQVVLPDIHHIKADYLIDNIERSFRAWRSSIAKNIPFADFCEYILPYRTSVEPLQDWRFKYQEKYKWVDDSVKVLGINKVLSYVAADYANWFTDTYGKEQRFEPLPRLGPMQLLFRKKGACEDIVDLQVFILRSQGLPSSMNFISDWATSTGRHFLNSAFDEQMRTIPLDVTSPMAVDNKLYREPAKVLRTTYSKQPGTLARFEEIEDIPEGYMQTQNYIDITKELWETADIKCKLFPSQNSPKVAYACVYNGGNWTPTWWGKIKKDSVNFSAMGKGAVYLPAYYINNDIVPAGYPVVQGFNQEVTLIPDTVNKRTITINEQAKYLIFRPGKSYRLYYWDNDWELVDEQIAASDAHILSFEDAPKNALFLLVPEYSQGKERPFIITDDGKRQWL